MKLLKVSAWALKYGMYPNTAKRIQDKSAIKGISKITEKEFLKYVYKKKKKVGRPKNV